MAIYFHSEVPGFTLKHKQILKSWITDTIADHGLKAGELNFIFCDDAYLHQINLTYLDHDTYTDIITFPVSIPGRESQISGDIYISVERVDENAIKFKTGFAEELHRVIIHGVLHLCGHSDKGKMKKENMRATENKYLGKLSI